MHHAVPVALYEMIVHPAVARHSAAHSSRVGSFFLNSRVAVSIFVSAPSSTGAEEGDGGDDSGSGDGGGSVPTSNTGGGAAAASR